MVYGLRFEIELWGLWAKQPRMSTAKFPPFKRFRFQYSCIRAPMKGTWGLSTYKPRISKLRASLAGKEIHVLIYTLKHVVVVSWLFSQGDGAIDAKTGKNQQLRAAW